MVFILCAGTFAYILSGTWHLYPRAYRGPWPGFTNGWVVFGERSVFSNMHAYLTVFRAPRAKLRKIHKRFCKAFWAPRANPG